MPFLPWSSGDNLTGPDVNKVIGYVPHIYQERIQATNSNFTTFSGNTMSWLIVRNDGTSSVYIDLSSSASTLSLALSQCGTKSFNCGSSGITRLYYTGSAGGDLRLLGTYGD